MKSKFGSFTERYWEEFRPELQNALKNQNFIIPRGFSDFRLEKVSRGSSCFSEHETLFSLQSELLLCEVLLKQKEIFYYNVEDNRPKNRRYGGDQTRKAIYK